MGENQNTGSGDRPTTATSLTPILTRLELNTLIGSTTGLATAVILTNRRFHSASYFIAFWAVFITVAAAGITARHVRAARDRRVYRTIVRDHDKRPPH